MSEESIFNNRFSPRSHFFTDPSLISQTSGQAFGPVSLNEFRVTAKFTAGAGAMAYAICKGTICIQPQTGSTDKVNVILHPYTQPIQGVNVRYFIYRGLKKSDFFTIDNQVIPSSGSTSDFVNKINDDFEAFYADEDEMPVFKSTFLGFNPLQTELITSLDSLFFKITETTTDENDEEVETQETVFELPLINSGESLGTFSTGECGVDVVLNYGDYHITNDLSLFALNLGYARAAEGKITLTGTTDPFEIKLKKEQIFQFIDIAAYYGFHHTESGEVYLHDSETPLLPESIYSEVLAPFYTKNNYYLYIQSDRERSYDFYGNYKLSETGNDNLLYGLTENSLNPREYATDGWPLIIESAAQSHSEERNTIFLQLTTDNNPNVVLYGQTACVDNAEHNYFSGPDQLITPADENGSQPARTTKIVLSNPAVTEGSVKKHIVNFGFLIYQGAIYEFISGTTLNENEEEENVFSTPNFFDDVFGGIDAEPMLKSNQPNAYTITSSQRLKLINHNINGKQLGISGVQTLIINDMIDTGDEEEPAFRRVTYLTETVDLMNNPASSGMKISSAQNTTSTLSKDMSVTYNLPSPFYYSKGILTNHSETVTTLKLFSFLNDEPNKIILGISRAENDVLNLLITDNTLYNPRLFLTDLFTDNHEFVSVENVKYQKYHLCIVGETAAGELKLLTPNPAINIYSIDRKYHYSKTYSDFMPEYNVFNVTIDLTPDNSTS